MTDAPKSATLLNRVQARLRTESVAKAIYVWSLVILGIALAAVLAIRLLGLLPPGEQRPIWLLAIPVSVAVLAGLFHRRVQRDTAARALDQHANTRDLFLTLSTLSTSAGEYQPLVAESAEKKADQIEPDAVVRFDPWPSLGKVAAMGALLAVAIWLTPQLDPFGKVEAATQQERQEQEIAAIRKANENRAEQLKKKQRQADEASDEIDDEVEQLKTAFRGMRPNKKDSNTKVLTDHRQTLSEQWKSVSNDQLRQMMSQPISDQQIGSSRTAKMNEWLKDLQEGKTESLQKELKEAQETMQAMLEAKDPEERKKLASQLKRELQDLKKFADDKAGSKELSSALSKAMKALEAAADPNNTEKQELSQDAVEALKESLELSEEELEQVAQAAQDLKKLEDALKTLQQAQKLNQNGQLDGEKCEGCESMEDYAEMYAQMMGPGAGEGDKDRNDGGGGGVGRGGETPEDDSDPEGYKDEKSRTQIKAGKVLLAIKTKEYAEEADFDPDAMREYQAGVQSVKQGVQAAIESEQIPPGYVDSIKKYFDKIEDIDPNLKTETSGEE